MMHALNVLEIEQKAGERLRGALPAHTWPGAYPIVYYTGNGDMLCADCATVITDYTPYPNDDPIVAIDAYWEGPDEHCAECNAVIQSAYGDPDDTEETSDNA